MLLKQTGLKFLKVLISHKLAAFAVTAALGASLTGAFLVVSHSAKSPRTGPQAGAFSSRWHPRPGNGSKQTGSSGSKNPKNTNSKDSAKSSKSAGSTSSRNSGSKTSGGGSSSGGSSSSSSSGVSGGGAASGGPSSGGGSSGGGEVMPTAPSGAYYSGIVYTSLSITFNAGTSPYGIAKHELFRNGTLKASSTSQSSVITLTDNTVYYGNTYSYTVVAVDNHGNVSPASNTVTVTLPPDTQAPTAPANFHVISNQPGDVWLGWDLSTDDKTSPGDIWYIIESQDSSYYVWTQTDPHDAITLNSGQTYTLYISAIDLANNVSTKTGPLTFTAN